MCQPEFSYIGQGLGCQPGPLASAKGPPVLVRGPRMSARGPPISVKGPPVSVCPTVSARGPPISVPYGHSILYRLQGLLCRQEGLSSLPLPEGLLVGMKASCVAQVSFPIGRSAAPNFLYRSRTRADIIHRHYRTRGGNATPRSQ